MLPRGWIPINEDADYIPNRRQNNAPARRNPEIDPESVIQSRRTRGPRQTHAAYYAAFAAAITELMCSKEEAVGSADSKASKMRLHRDELPPPPKRVKDLKTHRFGSDFWKAMDAELKSCWQKGCFGFTEIVE